MKTEIIRGCVESGKFKPDNSERFRQAFYVHEGKRVQLTIKREHRDRSHSQNKYYWAVICRDFGMDFLGYNEKEEAHEALKWHFLKDENFVLPTVKSTAKLSTAEFAEYIENIQKWASIEFNYYIPNPNEYYENYED